MKKKLLSLILVLLFTMPNIFVNATDLTSENIKLESIEAKREKLFSNATLEGDFKEDSVIVIMKEKYSDYNKILDKSEFQEVNCVGIDDLTESKREIIAKRKAEKMAELEKASITLPKNFKISDEEIIEEYNIDVENFKTFLCLKLKETGKDKVLGAINLLEQREDIYYVGPNYIYSTLRTTPNDEYYEDTSIDDDEYQWAIDHIQLPEAWDIARGSTDIMVGVIDSGIDSSHRDLEDKVDTGLDINYTDETNALNDVNGHGTHVAGIIGANTDNEDGVAGTCWNVSLVSLKAFKDNPDLNENNAIGNTNDIVKAIKYAGDNGIQILNLSCGYDGNYDGAYYTAIEEYNGLVVCSAGNNGRDDDYPPITHIYPSHFTNDNIISVAAFKSNGSLCSFSNYGATSVDLAAPGEDIMSTVPTSVVSSGYDSWSGTSMATPYVTGVAALMLSANPALSPIEIKNIILSNVDVHSSLTGKVVSGGKLNAFKAVNAANNYFTYSTPKLNSGRSFFTTETPWFDTTTSGRVWPGDINGDGRTDLMGIDIDGNICYARAKADGSYTNQGKITVTSGFSASWFSSAYNQRVWVDDVNGDGFDDFMGISVAGKMYTMLNNKNFTFSPIAMSPTGTAFVSSSAWFSTTHTGRVWTGDINGDNKADFIGISGEGHIYYALGNGSGGFSSETKITMSSSFAQSWFSTAYRPRVWIADVNADNKDDVIGVSIAGNIYTALNNGNYTFAAASNKGGIAFVSDSGWFSTAYNMRVWPADINGDNRCDLVGISGSGNVYISSASTNGTYSAERKINNVNGYNLSWFSTNRRPYIWPCDIDNDDCADFFSINSNGYIYTSMQSDNFN